MLINDNLYIYAHTIGFPTKHSFKLGRIPRETWPAHLSFKARDREETRSRDDGGETDASVRCRPLSRRGLSNKFVADTLRKENKHTLNITIIYRNRILVSSFDSIKNVIM